jgi:protein O-GlcNAc transferase
VAADAAGIDPLRVIFAPRIPKDRHLRRMGLADLALDTRIYNGHVSTVDALWAGVPLVALLGRHFASRVAASLLASLGMPELIAADLEGYELLALGLASDRPRLAPSARNSPDNGRFRRSSIRTCSSATSNAR